MPTKLKSVPTRFSFHIPGVRARLSVVEFSATEYISLPFEVELLMTSKEEIPFEEVLNRPALLTVSKARSYRNFHGVIDRFVYTEKRKDVLVYQARMVPSLWLLSLTEDCRVFQDKSVPGIVQTILAEHQLSQSVEFRLQRNYSTMEFCAQFQESDFDFISRLLEQEGIFYFFEHSTTKHMLVLADNRPSYQPYQDNASVVYTPDVGENASQEGIDEFQITRNMYSGKVILKDYDFQSPNKDLTYQAQDKANRNYEIYHYPGRYKDRYGNTLARIRLQEMTAFKEMAVGSGSYHRFIPGKWFRLTRHEQRKFNRQFLLTAVNHSGYQPSTTMRVADDSRQPGYANDFVAIPTSVIFTPARKTPPPLIKGPQTAVVTGPSGEEIFTDEYGRVKVQFHWDRVGRKDDNSSGWIRVSQSWAGAGYGTMFLPRVGQEVIVDFLNGDLSQPIIVGRLYNGEKSPPHSLPDNKTISTMRSESSMGGGGSNELRFEDKKGAEEVYIHGQKNLTIVVENDKNQRVGNNLTETIAGQKTISVGSDHFETVTVNKHESVGGVKSETIGAAKQVQVGTNMSETVGADKRVAVGTNLAESIGSNAVVSVGNDLSQHIGKNLQVTAGSNLTEQVGRTRTLSAAKITLSAKDEISLKTGKASIILKKNGDITIKGKSINVNGTGNVVIKGKKVLSN